MAASDLHHRPGLADEVFAAIRRSNEHLDTEKVGPGSRTPHFHVYPNASHRQPPIEFGGVVLPAMEVGGAHANPPAGEDTPAARLVNVSRMALAARIKHGVPLHELLGHFQTLALVEEELLSRKY